MLGLCVAAVLGGCSAVSGPSDSSVFIAFEDSFQGFQQWTSFHDDYEAGPTPDVNGPRTQYINKLPPHGSTEFPIGTMIVEVREDTGKIFAGVKRGGNFNASGAVNWEWWELALAGDVVKKLWRGYGPQDASDSYGGDINTCNDCHKLCAANDYVCSPYLQLGSF